MKLREFKAFVQALPTFLDEYEVIYNIEPNEKKTHLVGCSIEAVGIHDKTILFGPWDPAGKDNKTVKINTLHCEEKIATKLIDAVNCSPTLRKRRVIVMLPENTSKELDEKIQRDVITNYRNDLDHPEYNPNEGEKKW